MNDVATTTLAGAPLSGAAPWAAVKLGKRTVTVIGSPTSYDARSVRSSVRVNLLRAR